MKLVDKCIVSSLVLFCQLGFSFEQESSPINRAAQLGLIDCYSAKSMGRSKLAFTLLGDFTYDSKMVPLLEERIARYQEYDLSSPESVIYDLYPAVAFGLTNFLDLSVMQPAYFDYIIRDKAQLRGGLGDIEIGLKTRIPGSRQRVVDGAVLSKLTLPTGNNHQGNFLRHAYYIDKNSAADASTQITPIALFSANAPTLTFLALGSLDLHRFLLHLNSGVSLGLSTRIQNTFINGVGVEIKPVKHVGIFGDFYAETRFSTVRDGFKINEDPFHVSTGFTFSAPGGATLTAGSMFKLSSNAEYVFDDIDGKGLSRYHTRREPMWQAFLQLGWSGFLAAPDKDHDMILDRDDICPDVAEDIDGYEDSDGCPDLDNDHDGIPDSEDSCPNLAEDMDGYEDLDGCPDFDNDGDGIPDSLDRCPMEPEDRDGYNDGDGCPDYDNDGDGIPDTVDKCPLLAEDLDGFEDSDGCPDLDNDMDGVADSVDNCPDEAGVAENRGCPQPKTQAKEIQRGRVILSGVHFGGGNAVLSSGSASDLDRVYQSLTAWPEIRLEIQSHTDNSANPTTSLVLSQQRAEAVQDFLVKKGVNASRLMAVGKGDTEPIADNASVQGRSINNRIEVHRID